MAPGVKQAMSDALETAFGWAFCVVALYSVLFVNVSGNGTLWDSLRGIRDAQPVSRSAAVTTLAAPTRAGGTGGKVQDRILMIPDAPEKELPAPIVAQRTELSPARTADKITDAPADAKVGKDWRMHLTSTLRKFTIYGGGEQRAFASVSAAPIHGPPAPPSVSTPAVPAPTPATSFSAYRAGASAEARPGVSSRVAPVDTGAGDGVRNFR